MSRMIIWSWVVCVCVWTFPPAVPAWAASTQEAPPVTEPLLEDVLVYRVRAGESLSEVARLFHVPAEQLVQLNHIEDPTRLQVGQSLKIPNAFAQQAAQLREENARLLAETQRQDQALLETQKALATVEARLDATEVEKSALLQQLAATVQWKKGALTLAIALIGTLGWIVKLRGERAQLTRRLTLLIQENTALNIAKEKHRHTAAQLELRYQKLYRGREEVPAQFVSEGAAILTRAFTEGCAQLEHLLTRIIAEREREEQMLQAEQKTFDFLLHPFRVVWQWYRLKYHEA